MTRRIVKSFTLDPENVKALAVFAKLTGANESELVREAIKSYYRLTNETPPADMAQSGASLMDISTSGDNTTMVVGESEISYHDNTPIQAGGDDGR